MKGGYSSLPVNVRVASWLGAECLRAFAFKNGLSDSRLDLFVTKIADIVSVSNIPEWDNELNQLEISGFGDPLPSELQSVKDLDVIVECVREISLSQKYGAHRPDEIRLYLKKAIMLSNLDLDTYDMEKIVSIPPEADGFGSAIPPEVVRAFHAERT